MKTRESPPRLAEHPELGRDWQAAAAEELPPERLASWERAIAKKVAIESTSASLTASTAAKIIAPLVIAASGLVTYSLLRDEPPAELPTPAPLAFPSMKGGMPERPRALEHEPAVADTSRVEVPSQPEKEPSRVEAQSLLPEQLGRFHAARAAAASGNFTEALRLLDQLERDFPASSLLPEARIAKAEYLVRAGRNQGAIAELQRLLVDPAFDAKRAVLLRLLGDVWMKEGRCDRAVKAFENAIAAGLDQEGEQAAHAAIQTCRSP